MVDRVYISLSRFVEGSGCLVAAPNRDKLIFNVCLWQPYLTTNLIILVREIVDMQENTGE